MRRSFQLSALISLSLLLLLLMPTLLNAQATITPSTWTWENYVGTTTWSVQVTEDETACGDMSAPSVDTYIMSIQHLLSPSGSADVDMTAWDHGKPRGTFSGNVLSMPARTIPDGDGTSKLTAFDITFTPDCTSFYGKYYWDYSDQYQQCSGSTILSGTRTDATGCPGSGQLPSEPTTPLPTEQEKADLASAHSDLDTIDSLRSDVKELQKEETAISAQKDNTGITSEDLTRQQLQDKSAQLDKLQADAEAKYQEILKNDPNNFWANWDMAELRKGQNDYQGFENYFAKAANNPSIFESTKNTIEAKAAQDLGLSKFPTADTSNTMRKLASQKDTWQGGWIGNVNVPSDAAADKTVWTTELFTIFSPKGHDIVYEAVNQ